MNTDPNPQPGVSKALAGRLVQRAGLFSVATAAALVALKAWAWWVTDGVSLLASLLDSLLDAVTAGLNYVAIKIALSPSDAEHRFGHGKAESLAGLGQSLLIAVSALAMAGYALDRLANPAPVELPAAGIGVMFASIALTGALLAYQRYVVRQTQSIIIRADSLHYATDWLVNLGVIVALGLSAYGVLSADAIVALLIAIMIGFAAWKVARDAVDILMDHELPDPERDEILALALQVPGVLGVHNLRTRRSATTRIIQLDIEVAPETPLFRAHAIGADVVSRARAQLGDVDISVHLDPAGM